MKLTRENLQRWKKQLNKMSVEIGYIKLSDFYSDEEWLRYFLNVEAKEVLQRVLSSKGLFL